MSMYQYYNEVKAFALAIADNVIGEVNDELLRNLVVDKFEQFAEVFDLNTDDYFIVCACNEDNNTPELIDECGLQITIAVYSVEDVLAGYDVDPIDAYDVIIDLAGIEIITEDGSEVIA